MPPSPCALPPRPEVRRSEVLAGLSYALDLTEGQRPGHAVRSALIGLRLADAIGLPARDRGDLFYALLMKDLGCSSNAARFAALFGHSDHELKAAIKTIDWSYALQSYRFAARHVAPGQFWLTRVWRLLALLSHGPEGAREVVRTRCERGAEIATLLGLAPDTVQAIRALDEHWNGRGQPYSKRGEEIPLFARILNLAQTMEVFATTYDVEAAYDMAAARRGRWFDPALVDALRAFRTDTSFWNVMASGAELDVLARVAPPDSIAEASDAELDRVAEAFARVIDAKSPWTYQHSNGVAALAEGIAGVLGVPTSDRRLLRRAALLHDLGKLGVSNLILDKPSRLTDDELAVIRRHPGHTAAILNRVSCFRDLSSIASSHHERLDGTGYHRNLTAESLSRSERILCTADIADALRASRPYRAGLPPDRVLAIMARDVGSGLDGDCVAALRSVLESADADPSATPAAALVRDLAEDYTQAA